MRKAHDHTLHDYCVVCFLEPLMELLYIESRRVDLELSQSIAVQNISILKLLRKFLPVVTAVKSLH